jgi:hypothetical protein
MTHNIRADRRRKAQGARGIYQSPDEKKLWPEKPPLEISYKKNEHRTLPDRPDAGKMKHGVRRRKYGAAEEQALF